MENPQQLFTPLCDSFELSLHNNNLLLPWIQ